MAQGPPQRSLLRSEAPYQDGQEIELRRSAQSGAGSDVLGYSVQRQTLDPGRSATPVSHDPIQQVQAKAARGDDDQDRLGEGSIPGCLEAVVQVCQESCFASQWPSAETYFGPGVAASRIVHDAAMRACRRMTVNSGSVDQATRPQMRSIPGASDLPRAAYRDDRRQMIDRRRPGLATVRRGEDLARLGAEVEAQRLTAVMTEGLP